MRFSRAKPTGSFRVFHPSSRRVAAQADTLGEARKEANFWAKASTGAFEIQERFPSGAWVAVETVAQRVPPPTKSTARPKRAHAAKRVVRGGGHATKRVARETKPNVRDKTSDKINIDQLAKLLGLPDWERIDEMNQQNYWEMSSSAGDEDAQMEAERRAQDDVYGQWYDAVESTAEKLFEQHGLELKPTGKQGSVKRRYDFKIDPSTSWNDAANKIRETINGVGDFHFDNLREFLDSGPYTARQAVLSHLSYIKRYPAVYGGQGAHQMYEAAF